MDLQHMLRRLPSLRKILQDPRQNRRISLPRLRHLPPNTIPLSARERNQLPGQMAEANPPPAPVPERFQPNFCQSVRGEREGVQDAGAGEGVLRLRDLCGADGR